MPWLLKMTLLVACMMAPAICYLAFRVYNVNKKYSGSRIWITSVLIFVLISFMLFPFIGLLDYYATRDIDILVYPKSLTYWFWFGLPFVFHLFSWILIVDITKWIAGFTKWSSESLTKWHARIVLILFVIAFAITGVKTYWDTTQIKTKTVEVSTESLPETLAGFNIVHISDIQGDKYTGSEEIARYIDKVNQQNPDLIIFTGDLISYGTDYIEMAARELGKAKATFGTVAVVGDHDYWAGTGAVEEALQKQGISLLWDENHTITIDSTTTLTITGVTEVYSKASDPSVVDSLAGNVTNGSFKVFASHQVDEHIIDAALNHEYGLLLAGHTHGGQVWVPFMGMHFSAAERETKYVQGMYHESGLPISINNGLGFTLAPIRYGAPPAITILKLVGQ